MRRPLCKKKKSKPKTSTPKKPPVFIDVPVVGPIVPPPLVSVPSAPVPVGADPSVPDPVDPPAPVIEQVDLISNNDFEGSELPTSCFEPFSQSDGAVASTATSPIAGAKSLDVSLSNFGRVGCIHEYGFEEGPIGESVTAEGDLRIDAPTNGGGQLKVCAIVYFEGSQEPEKACQSHPVGNHDVVHVQVTKDTQSRRLQRVFFLLEARDSAIEATLDDAHLHVEQVKGSAGPRGGGGGGGGGSSNAGRYVAMVSPTDGETFTRALDLRLVGIGHDPNVFTNEPVDGRGTNAAKVEFFLDDTLIYEQDGSDAEYHVFKGFVNDLDIEPGEHTVWARATYVDPPLQLDSEPVTIMVESPPAYAQTVNLQNDVVLSTSQSYELVGAPNARIRLNGNGHRIVAPSGTSGRLTLKYVDVYDLGSSSNTAAPGIDVTTTGSTGAVTIEDSVFDSSNSVDLRLDGSSTASVKRNLFRSNMRTPVGQQPGSDSVSPTIPVVDVSGSSAAPKTFAGNNVGAGPVHFDHANRWTIGGTTDADSNVLIGPRAAFELISSANMTVKGNFVDHDYYGGWSQGQLLELHGTSPITVEHNVLMDSSWPVRGLGGEFRYNLVLEAGHEWMVPDDDAYIHHNVFVGGDNDQGGITGYYDISARIENNTFDGLLGEMAQSAVTWHEGQTTLKSNAFMNFPTGAVGVVNKLGGAISADYNGFFNPQGTNYTDGSAPAHDVDGGASANPRFAGPLPTTTFDMDKVDVWQRELPVSQILSAYRARYTPTQGSHYIDTGDPAGGAGNDVGAIGAGSINATDRFGSFAQDGWTPPPTPPSP